MRRLGFLSFAATAIVNLAACASDQTNCSDDSPRRVTAKAGASSTRTATVRDGGSSADASAS